MFLADAKRKRSALPLIVLLIALFASSHAGPARRQLALSRSVAPIRAVNKRPNVLVIVTDDQRGGLEVMPQTRRFLKKRGVTYPNAYAPTPLCCPARATIFTGRYAHNHRVLNNHRSHDLDHRKTLQRYLDDAGYRTGLFGKFFNEWRIRRDPPHFDKWLVKKDGQEYFHAFYNDNGRVREVDRYSTTFISSRAQAFLRRADNRRDSKPWLLFVTPQAPHNPFSPEPRYVDASVPSWNGNPAVFESDKSDKPVYVQTATTSFEEAKKIREGQYRTLMSVDDMVGEMADTLRDLNELSNTLIIFVSDNGLMWGEHGLRKKGVPYQQSITVPMLIRWDGHLKAGSVDRRLVGLMDLAPTILSATGEASRPRRDLDGRSLLNKYWTRERALLEFWTQEGERQDDWAALHTKDFQYTEYYSPTGEIIFREYYNLQKDPWELNNLLGDLDPLNDPSNVAALHDRLTELRDCRGSSCP